MPRLVWYYHRIRSMDRSEVAWRVRNFFSERLDLIRIPLKLYRRLSAADIPCTGDFQTGFQCTPNPVLAFSDLRAEPSGTWKNKLCKQADLLMDNKLSFFDLEEQYLGDPIDWHRDHASGKRGPIKPSVLTDYRDFEIFGDCKLVWEPNRHHQFVVLARAYRVTGKLKYARKAANTMIEWIDANSFGYGMNWKSPLELGVRLINWVWTLDLIRDANVICEEDWTKILRTIYLTTWDIQRKYSKGSSANNHLIGEAAGVFIATSYFPTLPNAKKWCKASKRILERELVTQSFTDGCTREHAFGYQLFVTQFFGLAKFAGNRSNNSFSKRYDSRLHEMYRFLAQVSADTGRLPNLGDADDGYVLNLGDTQENLFALISVAAYLFDDPNLILTEASETVFWLFGEDLAAMRPSDVSSSSIAFAESGYYILRSDQRDRNICVFFDCAELGYGSIAAHGHADCLSFTLSVGGQELLVDSGTYDYFSYPEWRNYFRKTQAHNTLTIDDECQSVSSGPFMWSTKAQQSLIEWIDEPDRSVVVGEHNGYSRLPGSVIHRRKLILHKHDGALTVIDRMGGEGRHTVRRYFHLAPECSIEKLDNNSFRIRNRNIEMVLSHDSASAIVVYGDEESQLGWVSSGYHHRSATHTIVLTDDVVAGRESDLVITMKITR